MHVFSFELELRLFFCRIVQLFARLIDPFGMGGVSLTPELIERLLEAMGIDGGTMSDMEIGMERLKALVGQAGLEKLLKELEPEDDSPKPCPRCGKKIRVRSRAIGRTIETLSGEQTIFRNQHYCDDCKLGFFPRDAELGLPPEGEVSLELEKRLADFSVNDSYESCARRWRVHYNRPFSATMFRLVANRLGRRLEQSAPDIAQRAMMPGKLKPAERLYVMNDGGMVPMKGGTWREVKLGTVFREEDHVEGRKGRRGFIERARYVGVLGEQEEFKEAMRAALDVERWARAKEVIWLGDGARGNWTMAEVLAPTATQILDVQHAVEHGVDCGKALLGEGSPLLEAWQQRIEQLVYAGDVDAIVNELMDCWLQTDNVFATKAIGALIGYYRNNESRMRYKEYRSRGLMIGSGVIESAHRHVIQSRMKKAGQHWSEKYGARMVGLRAAYSTAGPEQYHAAINRSLCLTYLRKSRAQKKAA